MDTTKIEQYSHEWYQLRLGKFTSSEIFKLMVNPKTKANDYSESTLTYIMDKVSEILTGMSKEFINEATSWGVQSEHLARTWYSKIEVVEVVECGSFQHTSLPWLGSPDGLVGEDGMIEIKCPYNTSIHLENCFITSQDEFKIKRKEHYAQIQSNLLLADREWCDYVSFDSRINTDMGFFRLRIYANEEYQMEMIERVVKATDKLYAVLESCSKYSLV